MTKRWVIAEPEPALTQTLARELHLAGPLAQVLANRGYRDAETASRFLNPQLRQLGDPFDLPEMTLAVDRILVAIEKQERIVGPYGPRRGARQCARGIEGSLEGLTHEDDDVPAAGWAV